MSSFETREKAVNAALTLVSSGHGHYSGADGLIQEAKKIAAYLEGRDDLAPEATAVIRTDDQSFTISTGSSPPFEFEVVGSYTSGDRNI